MAIKSFINIIVILLIFIIIFLLLAIEKLFHSIFSASWGSVMVKVVGKVDAESSKIIPENPEAAARETNEKLKMTKYLVVV